MVTEQVVEELLGQLTLWYALTTEEACRLVCDRWDDVETLFAMNRSPRAVMIYLAASQNRTLGGV